MSFIADIQKNLNIDESTIEPVLRNFEKISLTKNQSLLKAGEICNNYYFLESGLLRFFHIRNEVDKTVYVVFENTLFTNLISLYNEEPSLYNMEAIEDSVLYSISKVELDRLSKEYHFISEYLRIKWEQNCRNLAEMKILHQTLDAKDRYEFFRKQKKWMQRVPQKFLASYMGITPHSLSRIRKKIH